MHRKSGQDRCNRSVGLINDSTTGYAYITNLNEDFGQEQSVIKERVKMFDSAIMMILWVHTLYLIFDTSYKCYSFPLSTERVLMF